MKKFITPDIAELIGAYKEGAILTAAEIALIQPFISNDMFADDGFENVIPPVADFPDFALESIPAGMMAVDFMDDSHLFLHDPHSVIGDVTPFPGSMHEDIIQQQSDTCAIKSQQIILHSFGIDISEESLTTEATIKGYYIPGQGSNPDCVFDLLNDHGVNSHTKQHATIYDLAAELAQGHKVIVGVDADELWRPSYYNDLFGEHANHALVVTGIDTSNPFDVRVIITDPGTGEVARSYPMAQFLDAWHDSSCLMVATNEAPALTYPNGVYNHEMIHFDYAAGHIPSVGNIPYDIFVNSMVPHMDDFYAQQLPDLQSSDDYHHMFDQMDSVYDSIDNAFDVDSMDDSSDFNIDIDGMFSFLI